MTAIIALLAAAEAQRQCTESTSWSRKQEIHLPRPPSLRDIQATTILVDMSKEPSRTKAERCISTSVNSILPQTVLPPILEHPKLLTRKRINLSIMLASSVDIIIF